MTPRVLVVDDDHALAEMVGIVLHNEGFDTIFCDDGSKALAVFQESDPDVVLLDWMLPGKAGPVVCREIRAVSDVPIIMLTARSDTIDVVTGLEAGADDYIAKPFKPKELVARLRARLRQNASLEQRNLRMGDIEIDVTGHLVYRKGEVVSLTPLEFDLIVALARKPWMVRTREELLDEVWGYRHTSDTRLVNVHIQRLRAKIEDDPDNPKTILTVRGVGYRAGAAE